MEFNIEKYSEYLEQFLIDLESMTDTINLDTNKISENICNILGVGEISVCFYVSEEKELEKDGFTSYFYTSDNVNYDKFYEVREVTGGGNVAIYRIYQKQGIPDWTESYLKRIKVLEKTIFAFNGRTRVINLIEQFAFKDQETGIYNLKYFFKILNPLIRSKKIGNYAACYFNLRNFSTINHQIGRRKGTKVMITYITELKNKLKSENEVICRVGGDNFCVLFLKDNLNVVMEHLKGIGITYDFSTENRVFVSASAGYYIIPETCEKASDIMDSISAAINLARSSNYSSYVFFDNELQKNLEYTKFVKNIFPEAIENEEFQIYYQPKIALNNYRLTGAEALCRWFHNGAIVPPDNFIPILEQSKLICALDFYMLEHVCQDIRKWIDEGQEVVKVSVNLSRRNLGDMDLLNNIISLINKYKVPHEYIEIELTETAVDVNFKELKEIVFGLQKEGISTSVDDFGMGYSSLSLIRELPWNVLKIDKSFLPEGTEKNSAKHTMLKYILAMAQEIGLECIVEGIETIEQVKLLKENNCYLAQGFYFDRPMPKKEFEKKLSELRKC